MASLEEDVLGIGVSGVSFSGTSAGSGAAGSGADMSVTMRLANSGYRRQLLAACIAWLAAHRERPAHTLDEVLLGGLLSTCDRMPPGARSASEAYTEETRLLMATNQRDSLEMHARNTLFKDLASNDKVSAPDGEHISFKPWHPGINGRDGLRAYVQRYTHGIKEAELADAYIGVADDIASLCADKSIVALPNIEKGGGGPADGPPPLPLCPLCPPQWRPTQQQPKVPKHAHTLFPVRDDVGVPMDADLAPMWSAVQVPRSVPELEEALWQSGHLSREAYQAGHLEKSRLTARQAQAAKEQKILDVLERKAKRKRYPQKVTNTHLLGQYSWLTPGGKATTPAAAPPK